MLLVSWPNRKRDVGAELGNRAAGMTAAAPYVWLILQDGNLPLGPDRQFNEGDHVCTATLIWPDGERPTRDNSLVIDPCFNTTGWATAVKRLASVGVTPDDIGYYFECHQHDDHRLQIPNLRSLLTRRQCDLTWKCLERPPSVFPGISFPLCPGHDADLRAVRFRDQCGELWITSDAVLNREWLVAWEYYWPNIYSMPQIVETWRSIGKIVAAADTIVPGHGSPIRVDVELLQELIDRFPNAEYASQCPDVLTVLKDRLRHRGGT